MIDLNAKRLNVCLNVSICVLKAKKWITFGSGWIRNIMYKNSKTKNYRNLDSSNFVQNQSNFNLKVYFDCPINAFCIFLF